MQPQQRWDVDGENSNQRVSHSNGSRWWVGKGIDGQLRFPAGRDPDLTFLSFFLFQRARPVPRVSAFSGQPITRDGQGGSEIVSRLPGFFVSECLSLGSSRLFGEKRGPSQISLDRWDRAHQIAIRFDFDICGLGTM